MTSCGIKTCIKSLYIIKESGWLLLLWCQIVSGDNTWCRKTPHGVIHVWHHIGFHIMSHSSIEVNLIKWHHMVSHSTTWCHIVSHGVKWCHMLANSITYAVFYRGVIRVPLFPLAWSVMTSLHPEVLRSPSTPAALQLYSLDSSSVKENSMVD